MSVSKVTRNYQVTLPRDIREMENIRVGDRVVFVVEENRVRIMKFDEDIIRSTAGLWAGMKETGLEYERRLRKEWRKREAAIK